MKYNFMHELDLSNPTTLIFCVILMLLFLLIGHKIIIPLYKKYLKKRVEGKSKKNQ